MAVDESSEVPMEDDSSSGMEGQSTASGQASGGGTGKSKDQKKKFDISLPA